jgi:fibronectin-binding autotransporter adhesin
LDGCHFADAAVFGAGTNGTYLVNLGGSAIYATNVTFNTSGYTLTNGSLTLEASSGNVITVATGVAATILTPVTNTAAVSFSVGSGATLSLAGGGNFPGNTIATGGGTIDFHAGTFSGVNFVFWLQTPATQEAATITTARVLVGYAGNSTYTINSPAAQLICTGGGANNDVGRGGSAGTLILEQGTVNLTASGNQLRLGYDNSSGSKGTLTVEGGTFNLGANTIYINYAGTGANNAGTVNLSGGTLTTAAIQFGNGGTYSAGSTASLNVSGGTLYMAPAALPKATSELWPSARFSPAESSRPRRTGLRPTT